MGALPQPRDRAARQPTCPSCVPGGSLSCTESQVGEQPSQLKQETDHLLPSGSRPMEHAPSPAHCDVTQPTGQRAFLGEVEEPAGAGCSHLSSALVPPHAFPFSMPAEEWQTDIQNAVSRGRHMDQCQAGAEAGDCPRSRWKSPSETAQEAPIAQAAGALGARVRLQCEGDGGRTSTPPRK